MSRGEPVANDLTGPRNAFQLLRDPLFGPFVVGRALSATGVWTYNIVAAMLAFDLTGSAFVVGLVSVAQFFPQFLAPLSGALADRGNRGLQLVLGRLIVAVGTGALGVWVWITGVDDFPSVLPILGTALIAGCGFVVGLPAMQAIVPSLVRSEELAAAVAIDNGLPILSRAAGPALGAGLALAFGPGVAFMFASLGNLAYGAILYRLRIGWEPTYQAGDDSSVRAGLSHVRSDGAILILLVGVTAVGIGADPAITLAPTLSGNLGRGSELVGLFASSFGVGAGVGLVSLSWSRRLVGIRHLAPTGLLALGASMGMLALSRSSFLTAFSFGIGGCGMMYAITSLTTQLHQRAPDAFRGRIMSLWALAFIGSRPFAAVINGTIADALSVEAALALVLALMLVAAWVCWPRRQRPLA